MTGDHALTARAVAELVGLDVAAERVVTGAELEALADRDRTARIRNATVLARIWPRAAIRPRSRSGRGSS